jgi:hypothetical protein
VEFQTGHSGLRAEDEDVDVLSVHEHEHVHLDESRMIEDVDHDVYVGRPQRWTRGDPKQRNELR